LIHGKGLPRREEGREWNDGDPSPENPFLLLLSLITTSVVVLVEDESVV